MEQLSEKQRKVCHAFYQKCRTQGVDPLKSEADAQRALLLARENTALRKVFDGQPEGWQKEAYRQGRAYEEEQRAAKKKAADDAKTAEQRRLDEQAAALEASIARLRGREKRMFFLNKRLEEARKGAKEARDAMDRYLYRYEHADKGGDSWGTLGGIAAGITGSTAVGAVVAADAMSRDAANRAARQSEKSALLNEYPMWQSYRDSAQAAVGAAERAMEKAKLYLVEDHPLEELMDCFSFRKPQVAYTPGNTMLLQVEAQCGKNWQVAGVDAVIDGCFQAEVYRNGALLGKAWLNLPRDGAGTEGVTLKGLCLDAGPGGGEVSVLILPVALWVIEKASFAKEVPTLNTLLPLYGKKYSWDGAAMSDKDWRKVMEERRQAAECKAAEERAAAEAQAKKTKKIAMIAAPIVLLAVAAMVVISGNARKRAAYDNALALADEGRYEEAIAAFTELGEYEDSAEQIVNVQNRQLEDQYQEALANLDEAEYNSDLNEAYRELAALGDYRDSARIAQQLKTEKDARDAAEEALRNRDLGPALEFLESEPQYYKLGDMWKSEVGFLTLFVGKWEYVSSDDPAWGSYPDDTLAEVIETTWVLEDHGGHYEDWIKITGGAKPSWHQIYDLGRSSASVAGMKAPSRDTLLIERWGCTYEYRRVE